MRQRVYAEFWLRYDTCIQRTAVIPLQRGYFQRLFGALPCLGVVPCPAPGVQAQRLCGWNVSSSAFALGQYSWYLPIAALSPGPITEAEFRAARSMSGAEPGLRPGR